MTIFTDHFSALAPDYDVVLSDVWGVVHNGVAAFPEACDALTRFREKGGTVVLITNAPRPNEVVASQVDQFGAPRSIYDAIVSSGDVTRSEIASAPGADHLPYWTEARSCDFRGSRRALRAGRERRLRGLLRAVQRRDRNAGDYRDAARPRCTRASCSWSAAIPTSWSSAARRCSIAPARSPIFTARSVARCFTPASPIAPIYDLALEAAQAHARQAGRRKSACWRSAIRCAPISTAPRPRHRLPVRHRRHSLRRIRRTRGPRSERGRAGIDRRRRQASRDCTEACLVSQCRPRESGNDWITQLRSTLCAARSSAAAMFSAAAWSIAPLRRRSRSASFRFSIPRMMGAGTPS